MYSISLMYENINIVIKGIAGHYSLLLILMTGRAKASERNSLSSCPDNKYILIYIKWIRIRYTYVIYGQYTTTLRCTILDLWIDRSAGDHHKSLFYLFFHSYMMRMVIIIYDDISNLSKIQRGWIVEWTRAMWGRRMLSWMPHIHFRLLKYINFNKYSAATATSYA